MDLTSAMFFAVLFAGASTFSYDEEAKRHFIYWDPAISEIIKDPSRSLQVEMGEFMDIVCPFTNIGITDDATPPALFDLYNVTEKGFRKCDPTGQQLIFACSLPEQENKLTIKFQSISPSPFGFRFQECQEYYFLAVKRSDPKSNGHREHKCTTETERLRIKVGCSHDKDDNKHHEKPVATTTTHKPKSLTNRIKDETGKGKKDVVVPEISPVTSKPTKNAGKLPVSASRSGDNDGGNGGCRTVHFSAFTTLFFALLPLVWFSNSSS